MTTKTFKLSVFKRAAKPRSKRMREGAGARTSSTVVLSGTQLTPLTQQDLESEFRQREDFAWGSVRFVGTLPELSSVIKEGTLIDEAAPIAYYDKRGSRFVFRAADGTYYTHAKGSERYNDSATQKARVYTYYISNKDEIFYYNGGSMRQLTNQYSSVLIELMPMPFEGVTTGTLTPSSITTSGEVWYLSNINRFAMKVGGKFYGGWPSQALYQEGNEPHRKMYYSPSNIYYYTGAILKQYK